MTRDGRDTGVWSDIVVQTIAGVLSGVLLLIGGRLIEEALQDPALDAVGSGALAWLAELGPWRFVVLGGTGVGIIAAVVLIVRRLSKRRRPVRVAADADADVPAPRDRVVEPPGCEADLERLPRGSGPVLGRDAIVADLGAALADMDVAIYALVGLGGIGKTSIVRAFCDDLASRDYDGLRRVFAWSFGHDGAQGAGVDRLGEFWDTALRFWGHEGDPPVENSEKARILVRLLQSTPGLLVLDNLEVLQRPDGSITDRPVALLLDALRREGMRSGGLVVVTSRRPVDALAATGGRETVRVLSGDDLRLSDEAGAELLASLGVRDGAAALVEAARTLGGHALTIMLVGTALVRDFGGDVTRLPELLEDLDTEDRVTAILEYYLAGWPEDAPERRLMLLLSLHAAPAHADEIATLIRNADAAGPLKTMPHHAVVGTLERLAAAGLVVRERDAYALHALARAFFAARFEETDPEGFAQGHGVLCDLSLAAADPPATSLAGLAPLYEAIYHGCRAGRYREMFEDVYWPLVSDGNRFLNATVLGDRSGDLRAIDCFFPEGIAGGESLALSDETRWWLLAKAAFDLSSLGRFVESIGPRRVSIGIIERLECWALAADDNRRLVHVFASLGRLAEARVVARTAVAHAERLRQDPAGAAHVAFVPEMDAELLWRKCIADAAYVSMLMGKRDDVEAARTIAGDAEGRFLYHRFLLAEAAGEGDLVRVEALAAEALEEHLARGSATHIANTEIVLGQARRRLGRIDEAEAVLLDAQERLDHAGRLDGLMRATTELAAVHLERWRASGEQACLDRASFALDELGRLAEFSGAALLKADGEVVRVSVLHALGKTDEARAAFVELEREMDHMGYRLHDAEMARVRAEVHA